MFVSGNRHVTALHVEATETIVRLFPFYGHFLEIQWGIIIRTYEKGLPLNPC